MVSTRRSDRKRRQDAALATAAAKASSVGDDAKSGGGAGAGAGRNGIGMDDALPAVPATVPAANEACTERLRQRRREAVSPRGEEKVGDGDGNDGDDDDDGGSGGQLVRSASKKRKITTTKKKKEKRKGEKENEKEQKERSSPCLPRTLEKALRSKHGRGSGDNDDDDGDDEDDDDIGNKDVDDRSATTLHVMGVDEAGRGPLAGPVVAAAVILPRDVPGVTNSQKIASEEAREELYKRIVSSPGVRWAAAVIDAGTIDEINILAATMRGMHAAVEAMMMMAPPPLMMTTTTTTTTTPTKAAAMTTTATATVMATGVVESGNLLTRVERASADVKGCYVVCGLVRDCNDGCNDGIGGDGDGNDNVSKFANDAPITPKLQKVVVDGDGRDSSENATGNVFAAAPPLSCYYALVGGNRIPPNMPCDCQAVVKGNSREYCIAAASVVAKVTRDRLMREYDAIYPQYELKQHKGYPTAAHMDAVRLYGASPIHRRTFAPLKHMSFDEDGRVVVES